MRKSKPEPEVESENSLSEPEIDEKISAEEKEESEVSKGESSEEEAKPAKQNGKKVVPAKKVEEDDEDSKGSENEMENGNENRKAEPVVEDAGLKNRSETDYKSIDFTCTKKTPDGEDWNFKIACWNIGGIKAWLKVWKRK